MKKMTLLIAIFMLAMGYGFYSLFHSEPTIKSVTDSNFEGTPEHINGLRKAFTGDWRTTAPVAQQSQLQVARNNLSNPVFPEPNNSKPFASKPEKEDTKKKKKKTTDKKKPTKFERYVSRNNNFTQNFKNPEPVFAMPAPPTAPQNPPAIDPKKAKTVSEWLTLITNSPSSENLNSLILSYQARTITAQVFYGVLDKLIDSKKPEIRAMAVTALVATPSAASFELLVEVISKEPATSPNLAKAKAGLDAYKKVNNLSTLNHVLTSKVAGVQTAALTIIQQVANSAFSNQPDQAGNPIYSQSQLQQIINVFSQSLRILQTIAASSTNTNPLIQQTIATLQNLLKA